MESKANAAKFGTAGNVTGCVISGSADRKGVGWGGWGEGLGEGVGGASASFLIRNGPGRA